MLPKGNSVKYNQIYVLISTYFLEKSTSQATGPWLAGYVIDSFEKYFRVKHELKEEDLYEIAIGAISLDIILIEVILKITTKNRSRF